jgi:hypothetical protein
MIARNQDGQITFTVDDRDEVISALKEVFRTTDVGKLYLKDFYTKERGDDHAEKILAAAIQISGSQNISVQHLTRAVELLLDSGEIQPRVAVQAAQLEEPEPDTRPKGRDGKPLSDSQLKWQEYRIWSETASSSERKLRTQSDPGYATYVRKAYQAEMDQEIGGAVTPLGQPTTKARASKELESFAQKFLVEPSSNLRPKNGMVSLAGEQISWPAFNELLSKATAARLL